MVNLNNKDADFIAGLFRNYIVDVKDVIKGLRSKLEVTRNIGISLDLIPDETEKKKCLDLYEKVVKEGEKNLSEAVKDLGDMEKALVLLYEGSK